MSNPRDHLTTQIKTSFQFLQDINARLSKTSLFNYQPNSESRKTGEILLHIIRSFEYYLNGVCNDNWEPLTYNVETYNSFEKIEELLLNIESGVKEQIDSLNHDSLHKEFTSLDTPTFGLNLMIELLYHQLEHLGQLQLYFRLNNMKPLHYPFII